MKFTVKIQFTGCEKSVEIEAETAQAAEKIAFNQLSLTEINELVDYTAEIV